MKPLPTSLKVATLILLLLCTFSGKSNAQKPGEKQDSVKIGLLIPDSTSVAAKLGAELAIKNANASGGFNGHPFKLIVKYLDGPWGTGSKQAVSMIFDDKVWALVGSHDGRNAHLVEQAATKARVVFISAWSGDPTLSQAFVPWFFNSAPNYDQQATALVDGLYSGTSKESIAVICDKDYDSQSSLKSLLMKLGAKGLNKPVIIEWEASGMNPALIAEKIMDGGFSSVVILCRPEVILKLVELFIRKKPDLKLFSTVTSLNENQLDERELKLLDDNLFIPSAEPDTPAGTSFCKDYFKKYGRKPGLVATSAFDAMNIIILAIKNAGSGEREEIQKALFTLNYRGVTGSVSFDKKGNLKESFGIHGHAIINRYLPCF